MTSSYLQIWTTSIILIRIQVFTVSVVKKMLFFASCFFLFFFYVVDHFIASLVVYPVLASYQLEIEAKLKTIIPLTTEI